METYMDKTKMTKEEYEEYLDEIDLDEDEYEEDEIGRGNSEKEEKAEDNNQDTFETAKEFYRYDNGNRFLNPSKIFGALYWYGCSSCSRSSYVCV